MRPQKCSGEFLFLWSIKEQDGENISQNLKLPESQDCVQAGPPTMQYPATFSMETQKNYVLGIIKRKNPKAYQKIRLIEKKKFHFKR